MENEASDRLRHSLENEGSRRLRQLGFPEGTRIVGLAVSEPARCLIVSAARAEEGRYQFRLYVRRFDAPVYEEIPWPEGCNAFSDPIASPVAPLLCVLGSFWRGGGGDPVGLYRVRLPGVTPELILPAQRLVEPAEPEGRPERSWISSLLGFAADGRRLVIVRALGATSGTGTRFAYAVCMLDLNDGTVEHLASLPATCA